MKTPEEIIKAELDSKEQYKSTTSQVEHGELIPFLLYCANARRNMADFFMPNEIAPFQVTPSEEADHAAKL